MRAEVLHRPGVRQQGTTFGGVGTIVVGRRVAQKKILAKYLTSSEMEILDGKWKYLVRIGTYLTI